MNETKCGDLMLETLNSTSLRVRLCLSVLASPSTLTLYLKLLAFIWCVPSLNIKYPNANTGPIQQLLPSSR